MRQRYRTLYAMVKALQAEKAKLPTEIFPQKRWILPMVSVGFVPTSAVEYSDYRGNCVSRLRAGVLACAAVVLVGNICRVLSLHFVNFPTENEDTLARFSCLDIYPATLRRS